MARPGQLAEAIAEVLDLEPQTVRHRARMLRDAGLMAMERGGRGKGSMTPRDAVHLLLAAAGASKVKDSATPVEQHGACLSKEGAWVLPFDGEGLPELSALSAGHTFADGLEALVDAALNGTIREGQGNLDPFTYLASSPAQPLMIRIDVREPFVKSTISIDLVQYGVHREFKTLTSIQRHYQHQLTPDGKFRPPFVATLDGDLAHVHSFTHRTIIRIAQEFALFP